MPAEVAPQIARLRKSVLRWYDANRRDLPWRHTRDPYRIWVSEIMLQQTRVAAVLEHYRRWFELFPDVNSLALAQLDNVLAAWSGLGYYRRARMLHQAAKVVTGEMDGVMPRSSEELRRLPGIGRYTAAAIASIAFEEPSAVVDGNVERVLSRFTGRELVGEALWNMAQQWLGGASARGASRPGDWNQAMMELGATVCTPVNPQCKRCPLSGWCAVRRSEQDTSKSVSKPSAPGRKQKVVARALARRKGRVYLVQRAADASKMAGMWEFPETAFVENGEAIMKVRHSITDTDYIVHIYNHQGEGLDDGRWCGKSELRRMALTGLTRKVLRKLGVFTD